MHSHFTSEGSEFLDDLLRMEDLYVPRAEEGVELEAPADALLIEVLIDLRKRGYEADFYFETDIFALYGGDLDMRLDPEGFHVDEIDRIGYETRPRDGIVVYAISSLTGIKGILVDGSSLTRSSAY